MEKDMKTYKELQENIELVLESEVVNGGAARSAHSDFGVHRIEHDSQVGRMNAFLNSFCQREFLDPKTAIAQIRHKFNIAGLDFDWNNKSSITAESVNLPLKRWGGSFGTTPTHNLMKDGFYESDNIKEFNGGKGLSLKIESKQDDTGLYIMKAKIVQSKGD